MSLLNYFILSCICVIIYYVYYYLRTYKIVLATMLKPFCAVGDLSQVAHQLNKKKTCVSARFEYS